jgi:hypothetical protein
MAFKHPHKYLILGHAKVGKNTIMQKFSFCYSRCNNDISHLDFPFKENKYTSVSIHNKDYDMSVGLYRYDDDNDISHYKEMTSIIIIFDLTKRKSFENIEFMIDKANMFCEKPIPVIIIGNKTDLINKRAISFQQASDFANKHSCAYIEMGAKTLTFEEIHLFFKLIVKKVDLLQNNLNHKQNIYILFICIAMLLFGILIRYLIYCYRFYI